MGHNIFLALGSNLGHRRNHLQRAVDSLQSFVQICELSHVYETSPWGNTDQPNFLNLCLRGSTNLEPAELLMACKQVETELGRVSGEKWGAREIDLDILFYDDVVMSDEQLTIPHESLASREFVLRPLAELAPRLRHPVSGATVAEMLSAVESKTARRSDGPAIQFERSCEQPSGQLFEWGRRTYLMGIVNATPDSFSGDGVVRGGEWLPAAIEFAVQQAESGADVLDIGGQSSRPGSSPVSEAEELSRVIPLIAAISPILKIPISVDTYRAKVAEAALQAGASMINDVWGLQMDGRMAGVVAEAGCPVVIMHNRSRPQGVVQSERLGNRYVDVVYDDVVGAVHGELMELVELAEASGVSSEQIIIDPGIGFGKTVEQNLELLNRLDRFTGEGYPVLVGTSRKSFIGFTLNHEMNSRVEGTAATVAIAIERGADLVRVHDVGAMAAVVRMSDSIVR